MSKLVRYLSLVLLFFTVAAKPWDHPVHPGDVGPRVTIEVENFLSAEALESAEDAAFACRGRCRTDDCDEGGTDSFTISIKSMKVASRMTAAMQVNASVAPIVPADWLSHLPWSWATPLMISFEPQKR